MTESKVYVVQVPMTFSPIKKGWVNKYDLSPAKEYGTMVCLLPPGALFWQALEDTQKVLAEKLASYSEKDYILALGDPVAIAAAVLQAAQASGGKVNVLKFDKPSQRYFPFPLKIVK
jgi:hypothetical protein